MKIKFKQQAYQTIAVEAVADCFKGQPDTSGIQYRIDPGKAMQLKTDTTGLGFKNENIVISEMQLLENIQNVQRRQNLPVSNSLVKSKISSINLDIEMETGTGKTYVYTKTIFELNRRYGWSKFIIVVPSIAIREGVKKSLQITQEHFQEAYSKQAKFFIYNSKQLHNLESFSSDGGINVMIINVQAFNARGADARRIYGTPRKRPDGSTEMVGLDEFQSRKPINIIKANHPILILDEPQKMEGGKTLESLVEFNPLMILRYSATHKTTHNKVHRLDALDAYNQKLVKKIAVRGISVKGLSGTNAYLYLESIEISKVAPVARVEFEIKQNNGIVRKLRKFSKGDNLFDLSGGLDQYRGFVISDINAITDTVTFTNGKEIYAGEATGDVTESTLRRIQIREAIKAHFEKEQVLFNQGIKVLTLFFIDEVAKYRVYNKDEEEKGEYARIFEEEYIDVLNELGLIDKPEYKTYLDGIDPPKTHNGYFSIDKKSKRMIDPSTAARSTETDDVDAYDLILKDKERLLSFEEPVRFIFSHSALREGWDNPNVFVICTLKHSDNTISRRQEVGRGLRIAVNRFGERQDNPATVHQTNILTVVASESYKDFVAGLQRDISESLSERPRFANEDYFKGKQLVTEKGFLEVDAVMAKQIYKYLLKNDYTDDFDHINNNYFDALRDGTLAPLPAELHEYSEQIYQLIDSVYSEAKLPDIENDRDIKMNLLNDNFNKEEFKELWNRINKKAVYSVHFDSSELIKKCIKALDKDLRVTPLMYTIIEGNQKDSIDYDEMTSGSSFQVRTNKTEYEKKSVHSAVPYDLIGKICENVKLTRKTVSSILTGIDAVVFGQFKQNPESFIAEASRIINEQKATMVIEHLSYDAIADTFDNAIFTDNQARQDFSKAGSKLKKHIYDYVVTDSKIERTFVEELDTSTEVVVYAKLPRGFFIPTPVGDYNPDWAISFKEGTVKHIYFVAETKGSMSSMDLKQIELTKIECARRFFFEINKKIAHKNVRYDVVKSYGKLMEIVSAAEK